jgi:hypothetical protein
MTQPIGPEPLPRVYLSLKQDVDPEKGSKGDVHLIVSQGKIKADFICRVIPDGLTGKVTSILLKMYNWVPIEYFKDKHITVFVHQSDIEKLDRQGVRLPHKGKEISLPRSMPAKVEEFFEQDSKSEELEAAHFQSRIQACIESGGKTLVLDGVFNSEGACPDIFDDPIFSSLEELSLKGIRVLPDSIIHLKHLKSIDLSDSPIITLPKWFAQLKDLQYINLAYSGINQISAIKKFGQEYVGGSRTVREYEEEGAKKAVDELFAILSSLDELKAVNMSSKDTLSLTANLLDLKLVDIGKLNVVKYTDYKWKGPGPLTNQ